MLRVASPLHHPELLRRYAEIENDNTRNAYAVAVIQFARWCEEFGIELAQRSSGLRARLKSHLTISLD